MHAACLFRYRVASAAERGDLTLEEVVATSDGGPTAKIGLLLADHEKTLQDLVSQIVTHWKARAAPWFRLCRHCLLQLSLPHHHALHAAFCACAD